MLECTSEIKYMKKFDLNIEKILENWDIHHAIREIIANALDEQIISNSQEIKIFNEDNEWHIRDYGRGITYEHFTQNENKEKLNREGVIGKFGIGLKDALATFDRKDVDVKIISKHGEFTIGKSTKEGFDEITTLHIFISPPQNTAFVGTEFVLSNINDSDIDKAKEMFLVFSHEREIEKTQYGMVLQKDSNRANIYINGVKVSTEDNFLFSYNITSINSSIKKALNRERTNVGRSAYTERVKSILLSCNSWEVANLLISDLGNYATGNKHDELNWIDVQEHATKIYSKIERVVFVTSNDIEKSSNIIEEAKETGHKLFVIPENLKEKVHGTVTNNTTLISEAEVENNPEILSSIKESGQHFIIVPDEIKEKAEEIEVETGNTVRDFDNYIEQRNQNFEFSFITPAQLSYNELNNYQLIEKIYSIIGGKPNNVNQVLISETMQRDAYSFSPAEGLFQGLEKRIIIKRSVLSNRQRFIAVLLHEIAHAISGASDSSCEFENELTRLLGVFGEKSLSKGILNLFK